MRRYWLIALVVLAAAEGSSNAGGIRQTVPSLAGRSTAQRQRLRQSPSPRREAHRSIANRLGERIATSPTTSGLVRADVIPLPNVRQQTDYTCGPASLHSILRYFGAAQGTDEMPLARMMGTTKQRGTEPNDLVRTARRLGIRPKSKVGMTLDELARQTRRGNPVIVLFQAWGAKPQSYGESYTDGHYAVVIGVDDKNVYLQDPWAKTALAFVSRKDFTRRWHGLDNGKPVSGLGITIPSDGHRVVPHRGQTMVRAD